MQQYHHHQLSKKSMWHSSSYTFIIRTEIGLLQCLKETEISGSMPNAKLWSNIDIRAVAANVLTC